MSREPTVLDARFQWLGRVKRLLVGDRDRDVYRSTQHRVVGNLTGLAVGAYSARGLGLRLDLTRSNDYFGLSFAVLPSNVPPVVRFVFPGAL